MVSKAIDLVTCYTSVRNVFWKANTSKQVEGPLSLLLVNCIPLPPTQSAMERTYIFTKLDILFYGSACMNN